jgi:hypothetical protein
MYLTALFKDIVPYIADDPAQHVRSQMGLADVSYFFRRAELNERIQHLVDICRIDLSGEQLPIGIRTCAAFAELDIRFRVEHLFLHEFLNIDMALFQLFTPFEYDRLEPIGNQLKSGEHSRRTKADDNRPLSAVLQYSFFRYCFGIERKVLLVGKTVGSMNHER